MAPAGPAVEIPITCTGLSLNVALAGSLVAHRLAGMLCRSAARCAARPPAHRD
jgi:hypothetical protein